MRAEVAFEALGFGELAGARRAGSLFAGRLAAAGVHFGDADSHEADLSEMEERERKRNGLVALETTFGR